MLRDKQHLVHLLSVGRLYTAVEEIEEVLADNAPYQKAVLDLGEFFSVDC